MADAEVARIGAISAEAPLPERLAEAIKAVSDYQDRLWWVMRSMHELGWRPDRHDGGRDEHGPRQMQRLVTAVAALFQPQAHDLRLEPRPAAQVLLGLAFSNRFQERGMGEAPTTPEQIVDLFLHGALRSAGPVTPTEAENHV